MQSSVILLVENVLPTLLLPGFAILNSYSVHGHATWFLARSMESSRSPGVSAHALNPTHTMGPTSQLSVILHPVCACTRSHQLPPEMMDVEIAGGGSQDQECAETQSDPRCSCACVGSRYVNLTLAIMMDLNFRKTFILRLHAH